MCDGAIFANGFAQVSVNRSSFTSTFANRGAAYFGAFSTQGSFQDTNFSNCVADYGTVYLTSSARATFNQCVFLKNFARYSGAGIYVTSTANIQVKASLFESNFAVQMGAGIYSDSETLMDIDNSTFNNNTAVDGGGIFSDTPSMNIKTSTFSGNNAEGIVHLLVFY